MKKYAYRTVVAIIIAFGFSAFVKAADVTFTAVPRPMQVYPRDVQANTAIVPVAGDVTSAGFDSIILTVYRDAVLFNSSTQALSYSGGKAAFSLSATITAELVNYDFVVTLSTGGSPTEVKRIEDVVAGDIIMVNGQSNAEAARYATTANGNQHQFLRSFGTRDWPWNKTVTNDLNWRLAEGDQLQGPAAVGQWPLRAGRRLVDTYMIPIALINNAQGGQAIGYYQRNDSKPMDFNNNYGLTLFRCWQAGATNAIRAILWYQGESDNNDGAVHETGFRALYSDWMKNYGPVEKVYVCQVRVGCGVDWDKVDLRDRQRRFEDDPGMRVIAVSTTGLNAHDGCHFQYINGYELLGNEVFRLLARDLYGSTATNNISPPNISKALFTTADRKEVTVVMRKKNDTVVINNGAEADFIMEGASVTPVSGRAASNTVVLTLSRHGADASGISYSGHSGAGAWVTNTMGVGLLCFYNIPIEVVPFPQPAIANDAGAADILGTSAMMQGYVVSTGQSPTSVSLYWGTVDGGTVKGAWQFSMELGEKAEGPIQETIGSLLPATAYYYRYLAVNTHSESWADESAVFTTLPAVRLNNNPGATPIYTNAATLNGELQIASASPTTVSIYWGLSDGGTNKTGWDHEEIVGERSAGPFSLLVTGLTPATKYYYRSFAVNSLGEGWAPSSSSFSTLTMSDIWIREMEITLTGYTKGTTLVNYPVLVALNESIPGFSYSQFGKSDASDLRFIDDGMNELNYEIETWNFYGTSYIWVQVPQLQNASTKIKAIWGNSTAPMPACATNGATWSEGYAGVWHMNSTADLRDSTGHGWNGTLQGLVTNCQGLVGGALDFTTNGPTTRMTVGDIDLTTGVTMMAMINVPGVMWEEGGWFPDKFVFDKSGSYTLRRENIDWVWPEYWTPSLYRAASNGGLNWDGWCQIASTYDGSTGVARAYRNGVLQTGNISTGPAEALVQNNNSLLIGHHVKGKIDEARISYVPRSADWLWACYANHANPTGFSQCSDVQVIPEPAGMVLVMMGVMGLGYYRRLR